MDFSSSCSEDGGAKKQQDWIEEENSEWSDEGWRANQPDGVDDGHEEHEWRDLKLLFYRLLYGFAYHDWMDRRGRQRMIRRGRVIWPTRWSRWWTWGTWMGGSSIAVLQDYLLYGYPYHDWIEEEDSKWSDKCGWPDQPDGVDDGHEEHEWGDL